MARALFYSYLSHGRLDEAAELAIQPYMPARYGRQIIGARQDRGAQDAAIQDALALLFDRQENLQNPGAATPEVSTILNEVERQFSIDFVMGKFGPLRPLPYRN